MAKLKAHGHEVGTVYGLASAKRYMSDGHILRNVGGSWKLYAKVKPGTEPRAAFQAANARYETFLAENPAYAAYRRELHLSAGNCKRQRLHYAIQTMPNDADGVWSTVCDSYGDNVDASVDEIAELCRLYLAAEAEGKAKKPNAAIQAAATTAV